MALPGPSTQATLLALGFEANDFGEAVYLMHWHAIVDCGVINPEEVVDLLREQFPVDKQVDAKRSWNRKSLRNSLRDITMYCHKFRLSREVGGGQREALDREEIANLVDWYPKQGRGFQWFRFSIGMRRPSIRDKVEVLSPNNQDGMLSYLRSLETTGDRVPDPFSTGSQPGLQSAGEPLPTCVPMTRLSQYQDGGIASGS